MPDDGSKKAFIPLASLNGAAKGDKVMAKVVPGVIYFFILFNDYVLY